MTNEIVHYNSHDQVGARKMVFATINATLTIQKRKSVIQTAPHCPEPSKSWWNNPKSFTTISVCFGVVSAYRFWSWPSAYFAYWLWPSLFPIHTSTSLHSMRYTPYSTDRIINVQINSHIGRNRSTNASVFLGLFLFGTDIGVPSTHSLQVLKLHIVFLLCVYELPV